MLKGVACINLGLSAGQRLPLTINAFFRYIISECRGRVADGHWLLLAISKLCQGPLSAS